MNCKLLFISHERDVNGSTNSMMTLIEELQKKKKYDVEVLVPNKGVAFSVMRKKGINCNSFVYFNNFRVIGKRKIIRECVKEFVNFFAVIRLCTKIKKNDYDVVVSNSSAVDIGARACRLMKKQHVFYVREFMEEDFGFEYRNKKRMKNLFECASKVIFISCAISEKYITKYRFHDYRVVYNGIRFKKYYVANNPILLEPEIRFLQIGTFSDGKGTMSSIKLIEKVSEIIDCHLTLVGNGTREYLAKMEKYICENGLKERVSLYAYSDNLKELYLCHDILLMNSRMEGFGRVTAEGMIGGLLALGRDSGGTRELIINKKTGLLFSDDKDFEDRVTDIISNREKYRGLALYGQKYILENFSPENNYVNFIDYVK